MESQSLFNSWFSWSEALQLIDSQAVIYLGLSILLLWMGKIINDICTPYKLDEQLTQKDNKAISISFSGYIFSIFIIIWGILSSGSNVVVEGYTLTQDIFDTTLWSIIGIGLLQVARIINNKLLLYQFDNYKELVDDRNIGTGAVQCGAYIGSALMIRAATFGDDSGGFLLSLISALVYFFIGQVAFILFSKIYQKFSKYDLHREIERDNAAAGVAFGMTLIAIGILLSNYLMKYDSLIGLALWFIIGAFFLLVCRYLVDKAMLPGSLLDDEIQHDRNWGASFIEGASAIGLALILPSLFG